jgi:hypothetical protein
MSKTNRNIKDADSFKYRMKGKKSHAASINHSQQLDLNYQNNTQHYTRGSLETSPPTKKRCTSTVITQSKIVGFYPGEDLNSPTMPSTIHCLIQNHEGRPWVSTLDGEARTQTAPAKPKSLREY